MPKSRFASLELLPPDAIFAVDAEAKKAGPDAINATVGMVLDEQGRTVVLESVKRARQEIREDDSMAYDPVVGICAFRESANRLIYGATDMPIANVSAVGGSEAVSFQLQLFKKLCEKLNREAHILLPSPAWVNHAGMCKKAGVTTENVSYLREGRPFLGEIVQGIRNGATGVLLQGPAHNPSGLDHSLAEWEELADVMVMAIKTFHQQKYLSEHVPESGITMKRTWELLRTETEDPAWTKDIPVRHATRDELPSRFIDARVLTVPVINTRVYLPWLLKQNAELGMQKKQREQRTVSDIQEALDECDVVFNCTGMGSRDIHGICDREMHEIRGQLVRITNPGDIDRIVMDEDAYEDKRASFICPRTALNPADNDVILGGTFEADNPSLIPDDTTAGNIVERCAEHFPSIWNAKILQHIVGMRPYRKKMRIEREDKPGGKAVIHINGMGGSGFTVAEGAAEKGVDFL